LTTTIRIVKHQNMPRRLQTSADARRRELLDAALGVFLRFGFRKTSMEEVARAAGVSRQALYLHFPSKEELFRAALRQVLETSVASAALHLQNHDLSAEQRLVRGFDAWVGRFVGALGRDAQDLGEATSSLGKDMVQRHEAEFLEEVTRALRRTGVAAVYRSAGLSAPQLSRTLVATARGLKDESATREQFLAGFEIAVRALCLPLGSRA
jgi:AcrR family transcriptional regulator